MRALDPAAGPVERFACELRALRAAAGEPAFWKMARRCDVSKSSLAAAVAGYELPSERVARAFVLVCGGDWPWWSARLAQARAGLGPALDALAAGGSQHARAAAALVPVRRMPLVRAKARGDLVVLTGSRSSLPARPAGYRAADSRRRAHGHWGHRVIVLAAVALAVVAATAIAPFGAPRAAPLSSPPSAPPSTPPGLPAAIDLVRVVPDAQGDSHVTAQPLYLTAGQLGRLNAATLGDPAHQAWFTAHDAVDLDTTTIQIIVEGNRDHQVRIVDLQPVATCSAPLTGTLFLSPPAGGDATTRLFVDLDSTRRTLRYVVSDGREITGEDFFGDFTVTLARGEQQTFELVASSAKHYCAFTLNMTVVDRGQTVVEHISSDGRPFAVSALAPPRTVATPGTSGALSSYNVLYIGGVLTHNAEWVRADPNTYRW